MMNKTGVSFDQIGQASWLRSYGGTMVESGRMDDDDRQDLNNIVHALDTDDNGHNEHNILRQKYTSIKDPERRLYEQLSHDPEVEIILKRISRKYNCEDLINQYSSAAQLRKLSSDIMSHKSKKSDESDLHEYQYQLLNEKYLAEESKTKTLETKLKESDAKIEKLTQQLLECKEAYSTFIQSNHVDSHQNTSDEDTDESTTHAFGMMSLQHDQRMQASRGMWHSPMKPLPLHIDQRMLPPNGMPPDNMSYSPVQPPHFVNGPAMLLPNGMPPDNMSYSPVQPPHFVNGPAMLLPNGMPPDRMSYSPVQLHHSQSMSPQQMGHLHSMFSKQMGPPPQMTHLHSMSPKQMGPPPQMAHLHSMSPKQMDASRGMSPLDISQSKNQGSSKSNTERHNPRRTQQYLDKLSEFEKMLSENRKNSTNTTEQAPTTKSNHI